MGTIPQEEHFFCFLNVVKYCQYFSHRKGTYHDYTALYMVYILYPRPQKGALNYKKGMITHSRKDLIKPTIISFKDRKDKSKVPSELFHSEVRWRIWDYTKTKTKNKQQHEFHNFLPLFVLIVNTCILNYITKTN